MGRSTLRVRLSRGRRCHGRGAIDMALTERPPPAPETSEATTANDGDAGPETVVLNARRHESHSHFSKKRRHARANRYAKPTAASSSDGPEAIAIGPSSGSAAGRLRGFC